MTSIKNTFGKLHPSGLCRITGGRMGFIPFETVVTYNQDQLKTYAEALGFELQLINRMIAGIEKLTQKKETVDVSELPNMQKYHALINAFWLNLKTDSKLSQIEIVKLIRGFGICECVSKFWNEIEAKRMAEEMTKFGQIKIILDKPLTKKQIQETGIENYFVITP